MLAAARLAAPLDAASGGVAGALQECVLLLVSPDVYAGVLGKPQATTLSGAVLGHLAEAGMCRHLFLLLVAVFMPQPQQAPAASGIAAAVAAGRQGHHHSHGPLHYIQPRGHGHGVAHVDKHAHGPIAAPALGLSHQPPTVLHTVAPKPYVEALVTQLAVRLLALKSWVAAAPEQSLHNLLLVPDLWARCASLQPVAPRVTRTALGWLAAAGPGRLTAFLPPDGAAGLPGGSGAAVAVLVANVLAVGPRLLQQDKTAAAAAAPGTLRAPALATARVLHALVSLLPLSPFFGEGAAAGGGAVAVDDDEDEVDEGACGSLGLARLTLAPGAAGALPRSIIDGVQGLTGMSGRQLLKQLVTVLLPVTAPGSAGGGGGGGAGLGQGSANTSASGYATGGAMSLSTSPSGGYFMTLGGSPPMRAGSLTTAGSLGRVSLGAAAAAAGAGVQLPGAVGAALALTPPSTSSLLEAAEAAHAVAELVHQLCQLPGQRQRVMLGLALSCDFAERMWWSFLRPARLADIVGITWLPDASPPASGLSGAGSCLPGLSPCGTKASVSTSSSFNCSGAAPMEVELSGGQQGLALSRQGSRNNNGTGCGEDGAGADGAGLGGAGGGGGGGPGWRPRMAEELGWLLPLAVACGIFTVHVTTTTLDEFYGNGTPGSQRPLALQQLYDSAAPEAGEVVDPGGLR